MKTFRVSIIRDVVCETEDEAIAKCLADIPACTIITRDVTDIVCCRDADFSNGWRHSTNCVNYVVCF